MSVATPAPDVRAVRNQRRVRLEIEGLVQGVGARPHIHRLAEALGLNGWVANSAGGVSVEIEGDAPAVDNFLNRLEPSLPPLARLDEVVAQDLAIAGYGSFGIRDSIAGGEPTALMLPDAATCADCLAEIRDVGDRRHGYAFTSCTNCGPRFSIMLRLPFDRTRTTMRDFALCEACRYEYADPAGRRFHAQTNACPECGPQLSFVAPDGGTLAAGRSALRAAAEDLRRGRIVALKGLGGFQLLVDAGNEAAVARLRARKRRPHKPFALLLASARDVEHYCRLGAAERETLRSSAAPIVLLERRTRALSGGDALAPSVAPGNPLLGVMLPATPLHHLLMDELGIPLVATSGNVAGEPLVFDTDDALARLGDVADNLLVHDRPIACPLDDSVVRVVAGRPLVLRRARGYAPLSLHLPQPVPPILALGGHLKSTVAISSGRRVIIGPHVGDLTSPSARRTFDDAVGRLQSFCGRHPVAVACDRHPDYHTTRVAERFDVPVRPVQHHVAHIAACMADNCLQAPVLGVAWDGSGYGDDRTVWGGEFMMVDGAGARRVAHLRPFSLPGGSRAVTEPRRSALGLLYEIHGEAVLSMGALPPVADFTAGERKLLGRMLAQGINSPATSSVGRLFDAVASLLGFVQRTSYEGQAGMALEFAAGAAMTESRYVITTGPASDGVDTSLVLDWEPMLRMLLADVAGGIDASRIAFAFHVAMAAAIVDVALQLNEKRVVLSGGCFQNRVLTELTIMRLRDAGLEPFWHRDVPPNDGGLALGQLLWAARETAQEKA